MCTTVFGVPSEKLWGSDSDKNSPSPVRWCDIPNRLISLRKPKNIDENEFLTNRELLQVFGTDVCRDFYENFWVDWTLRKIDRARRKEPYHPPHETITDVRFPNEAKRIKDSGGIIVRLTRNSKSEDCHPSETAMDDWKFDFVHDNQNMAIDESVYLFESEMRERGIL